MSMIYITKNRIITCLSKWFRIALFQSHHKECLVVVCVVLTCLAASSTALSPFQGHRKRPSSSTSTSTNNTMLPRCHPVSTHSLRLRFEDALPSIPLRSKRKNRRKRRRKPRDIRPNSNGRSDWMLNDWQNFLSLSMLTNDESITEDMQVSRRTKRRRHLQANRDVNTTFSSSNTSVDVVVDDWADDLPPWHCHMTSKWRRMKTGIFPQHIQTGRCSAQKQCFYGMYECTARKYVLKVLKRSRYKCQPVPRTDTTESHYEEAWSWKKIRVTVACECGMK